MTDPGTADRTYIGPMSADLVEEIIEKVHATASVNANIVAQSASIPSTCGCPVLQERPDAVLPTMGGQTALNLAKALSEVS